MTKKDKQDRRQTLEELITSRHQKPQETYSLTSESQWNGVIYDETGFPMAALVGCAGDGQ